MAGVKLGDNSPGKLRAGKALVHLTAAPVGMPPQDLPLSTLVLHSLAVTLSILRRLPTSKVVGTVPLLERPVQE